MTSKLYNSNHNYKQPLNISSNLVNQKIISLFYFYYIFLFLYINIFFFVSKSIFQNLMCIFIYRIILILFLEKKIRILGKYQQPDAEAVKFFQHKSETRLQCTLNARTVSHLPVLYLFVFYICCELLNKMFTIDGLKICCLHDCV